MLVLGALSSGGNIKDDLSDLSLYDLDLYDLDLCLCDLYFLYAQS